MPLPQGISLAVGYMGEIAIGRGIKGAPCIRRKESMTKQLQYINLQKRILIVDTLLEVQPPLAGIPSLILVITLPVLLSECSSADQGAEVIKIESTGIPRLRYASQRDV